MDNRKDRRHDIAVTVRISSGSTEDFVPAVTKNLSVSGALLLTAHAAPRGALVNLEFPSFGAIGEVIWSVEPEGKTARMGIMFVSLSPSARSELLKLVATSDGAHGPM